MFYLIITRQSIERHPYPEAFTDGNRLKWLQKEVGGLIELVAEQFQDPSIALLCDEEGLIKELLPTCEVGIHRIHGPALVLGERMTEEGMDFCGLTSEQCDLAILGIVHFPEIPE
jgi:Domain of unknown function (DUF3846)